MMSAPSLMPSTNILVVDDTPDNLRLLAKILEAQSYTVRKALNGRMALQGAHRDPPDLILLDISMPEMNGYEVCQELKRSRVTAGIPVIFISALDQVSDKVRAFELGGQDYITKPFQELEVLARIRNQLLIQQQKRQLQTQQKQLIEQNQQLAQEIQERQQAELQVRQLNADLEHRVELRTQELQQALNFEATLKRVTDKVRDSLDQHQILQTAVEELAKVLHVHCCDAVLYSADHQSSVIRYQYVTSDQPATQGQMLYMADAPEIYHQLQQNRHHFAFCQIQPLPIRNHSAILACPIFDDRVDEFGILGDLWVFKQRQQIFQQAEIHLVQQVANQCAIALRQARLYEAAQAQVRDLERINQLKDDFLNTISHELRTPIASMQMMIRMLANLTNEMNEQMSQYLQAQANPVQPDADVSGLITTTTQLTAKQTKVNQYLTVLQEECDRELSLVEDLLHLQHLEAGTHPQQFADIHLQDWIPHIIEPFETRAAHQQQVLHVNIAKDLPTILIDPLSLTRTITELLTNACKYTPAHGNIRVSVQLATLTEAELPSGGLSLTSHSPTTISGQVVQLRVTNSGIEISPDEQQRIFDKFYRIPNNDPWKHGGTGLGLALVKKLVEQMGGAIAVNSRNNLTEFVVNLPIV